jgi:hypothetical protein
VNWLGCLILLLGYFVTVVVGATVLLWRRRQTSSIYNIESEAFEMTLGQVLESQGLTWSREGKQVRITPPQGGTAAGPLVLEVETFPTMCHVLLRWRSGDEALQQQIDRGLREAVSQVQTVDNPAGTWLLWTGASLFLLMFGILLVLLALTVVWKR